MYRMHSSDGKQKKNKRMQIQIVFQLIVGLVILSVVSFAVTLLCASSITRSRLESELDEVATYEMEKIQSYEYFDWLVAYWLSHTDEMQINYDDYDLWYDKCYTFLQSYHEGLESDYDKNNNLDFENQLKQLNPYELSTDLQKQYAEVVYEKLILEFDEEIQQSFFSKYRISCMQWSGWEVSTEDDDQSSAEDVDFSKYISLLSGKKQKEERSHDANGIDHANYLGDVSDIDEIDDFVVMMTYPIEKGDKIIANICLVSDTRQTMREIFEAILYFILGMFFILLILVILFGRYLRKHIVKPLELIEDGIFHFSKDYDADGLKENMSLIKEKNEIGRLARETGNLGGELVSYIDEVEEMVAKKQRMDMELDMAKAIQESVLTHDFHDLPKSWNVDLYAMMRPARMVGGDLYDFIVLDEDHLAIAVGDVSGKSIPAALFMMRCLISIKSEIYNNMNPQETLQIINDKICVGNDSCMFITLWLGIYEISTGYLLYSNAGHDDSICIRKGQDASFVEEDHGLALGIMEGMEYTNGELYLKAGDTLFIYTDGLPEGINQEEEAYGLDRILSTMNTIDGSSAQEYVDALVKSSDDFTEGMEQFDDITMLCLKIKEEK